MTDPTKRIVERFADYRKTAASMNGPGGNFNAPCREYGQVDDDLGRLAAPHWPLAGSPRRPARRRRPRRGP